MSSAYLFTPENRLAQILQAIDGPTVDELVRDAEARTRLLGEGIRAFVAEKLDVLSAYAARDEASVFAECLAVADCARSIAEVAEAADLRDVGEAARGICAMVENLISNGVWHSDALRLHLDALQLLKDGSAAPESSQVILERLREMRVSVGVQE